MRSDQFSTLHSEIAQESEGSAHRALRKQQCLPQHVFSTGIEGGRDASLTVAYLVVCSSITGENAGKLTRGGGANNSAESNHGGRVQTQRGATTPCTLIAWGALMMVAGPAAHLTAYFGNRTPHHNGALQHVCGALDGHRIDRRAIAGRS